MEQDLNEFKYENFENNDWFKLEYKNQDVKNKEEYKKWYKSAKEYIKKENLKRAKDYIDNVDNYNMHLDTSILTIEFCENCLSYTICSLANRFSNVICNKCKECFCIGCSRKMQKSQNYINEDTLCLKGYLKAFYLRAINRRSDLVITCACFHIMHIIFCLFITPLYIGFISNLMSFLVHRNKKRKYEDLNGFVVFAYFIYSLFRGLLMFPYIILFFPFMVILLLPGIFSYKYYLYIFDMYIAAIWPGDAPLANVGNN